MDYNIADDFFCKLLRKILHIRKSSKEEMSAYDILHGDMKNEAIVPVMYGLVVGRECR